MTVVLPAPLRPTSATTDPLGTVTSKSRTTGVFGRYSNSTCSNRISSTCAGAATASGVSGLSGGMPSTSNTRSMAARLRCSSENEFTMFHTGLSSRNVYHWKAMMSPMDARCCRYSQPPYQTITTFTAPISSPHDVQITISRRWANISLRSIVWRPLMYSNSSWSSRRNARTTRMPENVSPTRPSMTSASRRSDR